MAWAHSVTKVTSTNVHILRNKSIQRVKRSKVKLLKRSSKETTEELPPKKYKCKDNKNDDDSFQSISDENILIPSSPFHGVEESIFETNLIRKSREEVLEFLNLMKVRIIDSIKTNTPLSELHRQLDKRIELPFKELFDWRHCHFPPTNFPENRLMDFDTSQEMSEVLSQWYLESFGVKIPIYQYANDDFEFSTRWQQKSMNYSTKVLQPVLNELLINYPETKTISMITISSDTYSTTDNFLEEACVTWGGHCDAIELVNTCSVDNFITLLSLHKSALINALDHISCSLNDSLRTTLSLIQDRRFDQLRIRIAKLLGIPLLNYQYNLLGYEGHMVQLLCKDLSLCSDKYKITFQCWSCCYQSEKMLNLTTLTQFNSNCQVSINNQINSRFSCLKCRDPASNIERISLEFTELAPLFILEVGHLDESIQASNINEEISIRHKEDLLDYTLLGFTIHSGIHFSMRVKIENIWYAYDGMERPKLTRLMGKDVNFTGRIDTVVYVISNARE